MICKNCGTAIPEGSEYCRCCGMSAAPVVQEVQPEVPAAAPAVQMWNEPVSQPEPEAAPSYGLCANCGNPLVEGSLFCTACGTKVTPPAEPKQELPQEPVAAKDTGMKKLLLLGGTGVLLVASLIMILCLIFGGNSPESVAVESAEAAYAGDVQAVMDLLPAAFLETFDDEISDLAEEMEEVYEYRLEALEDEYGDYDITVEAVYVQEYTRKQLRTKSERYEEEFDLVLEDAAEVFLLQVIEGESVEEGEIIEIDVVKIDGEWCLDIFEID